LLYTAKKTGSSHLLLGTSLTSLAVSLITSIAYGSGYNIREEAYEEWTGQTQAADELSRPVRIIRPLRDTGTKECAAWAWWHTLAAVRQDALPGAHAKQSIGGLTQNFIVGLERDYPSTISTITRTCEKVTSKNEEHHICINM